MVQDSDNSTFSKGALCLYLPRSSSAGEQSYGQKSKSKGWLKTGKTAMTDEKTAISPSMFNEHLFRDHVEYYQIQKFVKLSLKWCELYITYDTYRKIDIARARDIFVSQESAFDTLLSQKMRTPIKIGK